MSASPRGDRLALLSFVLIVPALVTFVVGLASSGTLPLYVSLACSVVAGVALAIAARLRRRDAPATTGTFPVIEDDTEDEFGSFVAPAVSVAIDEEAVESPEEASAFAPESADDFALAVDAPQIELEMPPPPEPKRRRKKRAPAVVLPPPSPPPAPTRREAAVTYDEEGTLVFPIEDYESLSAAQVVKVLKLLDSEEIETVREHEAAHEARADVLERIDKLLTRRGVV